MNKNIAKFSFLLLVFGVFVADAEAYRAVETTSTKINDTTYLLTHTYTLGFLNAEMSTPVLAGTEELSGYETKQTTFSLNSTSDMNVQAIVVSEAAIEGNQYQVPTGERIEFTVIVLVKDVSQELADFAMTLESIPYTFVRNGESSTEEGTYTFSDDGPVASESAILVAP